MESNQAGFVYSDDSLTNIERRISKERLKPYLILAKDDRVHAIKFYEWNTLLSESLYGLLQGFEIVLRNTFHEILSDSFKRPNWFDSGLNKADAKNVADAKQRIIGQKKDVTPDAVVSELFLGFWVSLTSRGYTQRFWTPCLHKAFSPRMKRQDAFHALDKIRKMRNRLAHHQIILRPTLMNEYSETFQLIHKICPITAKWIRSNSTFVEKYKQEPLKPVANKL